MPKRRRNEYEAAASSAAIPDAFLSASNDTPAPSNADMPPPPAPVEKKAYSRGKAKAPYGLMKFEAKFPLDAPDPVLKALVFGPQKGPFPLLNIRGQIRGLVDHIQTTLSLAKLGDPPALYLSFSIVNDEVTMLNIYLCSSDVKTVVLLDIAALNEAAFDTIGSDGYTTLRCYLQAPRITKVLFDLRRSSSALFKEYDIRLQGVVDIQIWKNSIDRYLHLPLFEQCIYTDLMHLMPTFERGEALRNVIHATSLYLTPGKYGYGNDDLRNIRPLPAELVRYYVLVPVLLAEMWTVYNSFITDPNQHRNIALATRARILRCQDPEQYGGASYLEGYHGIWSGLGGVEALEYVEAEDSEEAFHRAAMEIERIAPVKSWVDANYDIEQPGVALVEEGVHFRDLRGTNA